MRKALAFLRRDWQLARTHPLSWGFDVVQIFGTLVSFYFVSRLVPVSSNALAAYGGNYFRFVLVGLVFSLVTGAAAGVFSEIISFEKGTGTLESLLLTRNSFFSLLGSKTAADFMGIALKAALYLLVGVLFFRADFSRAEWSSFFAAALITIAVYTGFGMLSAGFLLYFEEATPLETILGWVSRLLGGVYFPLTVLPDNLRHLARFFPLTYALEAIRQALILGRPLAGIRTELEILGIFAVLLVPSGWMALRVGLQQARRKGTLAFQ